MKPRHRRFMWIGAGVLVLAAAVGLVLNAFQSNLVFFFSPTDVVENRAPQGRAFRRAHEQARLLARLRPSDN